MHNSSNAKNGVHSLIRIHETLYTSSLRDVRKLNEMHMVSHTL